MPGKLKKKPKTRAHFAFVLALIALMFCNPALAQKESVLRGAGCLRCHAGIETINERMAIAWGADHKCEMCHYGQPLAATELEAHEGLISNPGDLGVIQQTCGKCHSEYGEIQSVQIQGIDNHVNRVLRSIMATSAGEIAGTRYMWNEQQTRSAVYGVRDVTGIGPTVPPGADAHLKELPSARNSDADSLLRGACLRCHLWTEDKTTPGIFRSGGCSACHVPYADDGLSKSGDSSISMTKTGRPEKHVITTKIPDKQCLWCHNDGGARIGLNYVGLAVTNSSLTRKVGGQGKNMAYGATVMHTKADVHYRREMTCIDCHDSVELHGDGNIYSHKEYQVSIRCESCHGGPGRTPDYGASRGRRLSNIEPEDGVYYLRSKLSSVMRVVPQPFAENPNVSQSAAIGHKGHERLECFACHNKSQNQCYCCHMERDDRKSSPIDWVLGLGEKRRAEPSVGFWTGSKLYQQWTQPILGINNRGRVSPFLPGGQAILTHLDSEGRMVKRNHTFTTPGGLYGFSLNPVYSHNVTVTSRTCPDCHANKKALGLGTGFVDLKRLGTTLAFSPDKFVDENGSRIQDSAHEGVRPFNGEELAGLFRTESCIDCHERLPSDMDRRKEPVESINSSDAEHHDAIRRFFGSEN